ncbi:MAG: flagellar biosynthesis anti-sigma factor FlgM [Thermoguttaceae bacterium]|jgi:anti-sigma28 factor (negative regulator of flagellin synthesis)|nr:flagellar biosynthesis anti-sigma factor FlgM [Thermoguttaceae bacterium]
MNINRISGAQGVVNVRSNGALNRNAEARRPVDNRDEMNISATREATTVAADPNADIRLDLVNRVRAEIQAGTYYSDEKFEIAIERMFNSFE